MSFCHSMKIDEFLSESLRREMGLCEVREKRLVCACVNFREKRWVYAGVLKKRDGFV